MFGNAEAYERFMGRWSALAAPQLVEFAALPPNGRILDVGSGTGSLTFAIAERFHEASILGIDLSKELVAYASDRNAFPGRAGFEIGDAQQLRFEDAAFDATASLLVFSFIPSPAKALQELRRVTRPGGSVSAAVWDYGEGMRMLRTFWDAAIAVDPGADEADEKHMALCRAGELSALWKESGLVDVREQAIEIVMRFETLADYWEPFLLGQGPAGAYVRRLGEYKLGLLRKAIKARLGLSEEDSAFVLPARAWVVRGVVPNPR